MVFTYQPARNPYDAVRALAPVRKYQVGRFMGAKPPKFKSGKAAPVEWQLRHTKVGRGKLDPGLKAPPGFRV